MRRKKKLVIFGYAIKLIVYQLAIYYLIKEHFLSIHGYPWDFKFNDKDGTEEDIVEHLKSVFIEYVVPELNNIKKLDDFEKMKKKVTEINPIEQVGILGFFSSVIGGSHINNIPHFVESFKRNNYSRKLIEDNIWMLDKLIEQSWFGRENEKEIREFINKVMDEAEKMPEIIEKEIINPKVYRRIAINSSEKFKKYLIENNLKANEKESIISSIKEDVKKCFGKEISQISEQFEKLASVWGKFIICSFGGEWTPSGSYISKNREAIANPEYTMRESIKRANTNLVDLEFEVLEKSTCELKSPKSLETYKITTAQKFEEYLTRKKIKPNEKERIIKCVKDDVTLCFGKTLAQMGESFEELVSVWGEFMIYTYGMKWRCFRKRLFYVVEFENGEMGTSPAKCIYQCIRECSTEPIDDEINLFDALY